MFTEKDSQSVFSLRSMSGQKKNHPKPYSYYHQKAAFASEKLHSSIGTPFFTPSADEGQS